MTTYAKNNTNNDIHAPLNGQPLRHFIHALVDTAKAIHVEFTIYNCKIPVIKITARGQIINL